MQVDEQLVSEDCTRRFICSESKEEEEEEEARRRPEIWKRIIQDVTSR